MKPSMKRARPRWSNIGVVLVTLVKHSTLRCASVAALDSYFTRMQNFEVDFEFAPSASGTTNEIIYPTESPGPSPAPSNISTQQPSHSLDPTVTATDSPTETFTPTPNPSESPTQSPSLRSYPTVRPTPFPTREPSRLPTTTPSQSPTNNLTQEPTEKPTLSPSAMFTTGAPTTGSFTELPLPTPTTLPPFAYPGWYPTIIPTTMKPSRRPTHSPSIAPTKYPTYILSNRPSILPSEQPMVRPSPINATSHVTPFPSETTQPSPRYLQTKNPSSPRTAFNDVPVTQFEARLAFAKPLNESQVEKSATELEVVLSDYLMQELAELEPTEDIAFNAINLIVTPSGSSARAISTRQRHLRGLQDESIFQIYSYNVTGTADISTPSDTTIESRNLTRLVDSSINSAFGGAEKQPELSEYVRDHPNSKVVSNSVQAGIQTQPLPPEQNPAGKSRPTVVAIVFGFILVTLAFLSLLFYAFSCWKEHKKRAAQRKRERQGVHAVYTKPSPLKGQLPQPSQALPGFLVSSGVAKTKDDSSEDGSSFQGADSETESERGNDSFARELKLAASLDRRAWDEYQRQLKEMDHQGLVLGEDPGRRRNVDYASSTQAGSALSGVQMYDTNFLPEEQSFIDEGFEVTEAGSTLIIGPANNGDDDFQSAVSGTTFPYGDEDTRRIDPPGPRSSSIQPKRILDDPAGIRVSQLEFSTPTEEKRKTPNENLAPSPVEDTSDDSFDPAVNFINNLSVKPSSGSRQAREAPLQSSRASPTESLVSSFYSAQAVILSTLPHENEQREAQNERYNSHRSEKLQSFDDDGSDIQDPSKDSNSFESLMTIDIVKEVQKLSSFVKSYEMKREKNKKKEWGRSITAAQSSGDPLEHDVDDETLHNNTVGRGLVSDDLSNAFDNDSLSVSSQSDWSSDGDYGPKIRRFNQRKITGSHTSPTVAVDDDYDDDDDLSTDSDRIIPTSVQGSDDSRLGIHPFNVQQIMAAQPDIEASRRRIAARLASRPVDVAPNLKPISKPPVTRNAFKSTLLSPIPATPDSSNDFFDERSPKVRAPLDEISENPMRTPVRHASKISPQKTTENGQIGDVQREHEGSVVRSLNSNISPAAQGVKGSNGVSNVRNPSIQPKGDTSWQKKTDIYSLRKLGPIQEKAVEQSSAMAPSDEELTKDGTSRPRGGTKGVNGSTRRSENKGFNNILSMFENKPKEAVFPPNEHWQYNF